MDKISKTKQWYESYYKKFGKDRNNIISDKGVLFQLMATHRSFINSLAKINIDLNSSILDVGCAQGANLMELVKFGFDQNNLYGVDINNDRIDAGKLNYPLLNLSNQDATDLNFQNNFFSLVFESTMFVQITDNIMSRKIAKEMIRVTKNNGYIILIDWRYGKFWNPNYLACNKKRVKELFNVGSDMEIISVFNGALIPPIGRFLSAHANSLYFVVSKLCPFLIGQVTYVLKKKY
tara:strand:- start:1505 stop:2209 length:705 start_codon:yes stop_codon:yes gene_type:complete